MDTLKRYRDIVRKLICEYASYNSPFAPSGPNCLHFKLPIESSPQAQPL